ncbi:DUF4262 domain-containing protein [Kitasatospora purpeofusca]|uniref:DUF4262 domain-containing protein n=1 Tax=Kitasatospora purpeofusca TaxID=67352 RepID=UPI0035DC9FC9
MPTQPDTTPFLLALLEQIDQDGHVMAAVIPRPSDTDRLTWAYTTGLSGRLDLELVVGGLPLEQARQILDGTAAALTAVPDDGTAVTGVLEGAQVVLRRANDPRPFSLVREVYGTDPGNGYWQVMWPDTEGRYPTDPAYDTSRPQPLR